MVTDYLAAAFGWNSVSPGGDAVVAGAPGSTPAWDEDPEGTSEPAPDDDMVLVHAYVAGGDPAAFTALVERHQHWVYRIALAVLGPGGAGDAQDVTQEVLVRLARHLPEFRGECAFRTWLRRMTVNLAIDRRRRARWRKPHVSLGRLDDRPSTTRDDDPYRTAEMAERMRAVAQCVDVLPAEMRSVIHLRYWQDLGAEEIAAVLRIPAGTVKSRLFRGRQLLYDGMRERGLS